MSLIPFDQLIRGYSRAEAFEVALQTLEDVGIPARSWREGGVFRSIVGAVATVGSIASNVVSDGIRGNLLGNARGPWLTYLARLTYGVERDPSTFASGQLTLTNQGGGIYAWGADELVAYSSATGKRYRATSAGNLPAFGEVTVDIQAIEAGSDSSAAPGSIDSLETTMARVVVGNAKPLVGRDEESDDSVTAKCDRAPSLRSANGPRSSYELACLSAKLPDGSATSINRVVQVPPDGTTTVRMIVATPSGAPTLDERTAARANIELLARTDTDNVIVEPAVETIYARTITIWRRGGDEESILRNARKALDDLQATYPIGGIRKHAGTPAYLWADALSSAVIASSPGVVFDVDQDAGDIELAYNEVPVLAATLLVRVAP